MRTFLDAFLVFRWLFRLTNRTPVRSLYLEQSLRLVNPRVSLHYMDYSKYFGSASFTEGHLKDTMDGGSWSEFLSEKWFGKNDPATGQILNSRWKDTTLPEVSSWRAWVAKGGTSSSLPGRSE